MAYTGGELNLLNGKYGISAPHKSVPVMKLIKTHQPKSKDELYELIKYHFENNCPCGIKSKGTIEDFGKALYKVQLKEWGTCKYTLQQCIQWEYDLFILQSLKGTNIEEKALLYFQKNMACVNINAKKAEGFVDEELRIDLIIFKNNIEICGLQVKPISFNNIRRGIIDFNKKANSKWGKPVYYLFYDENENFTNMDETVQLIIYQTVF